jgi:Tfp pilus assembly protein PilV
MPTTYLLTTHLLTSPTPPRRGMTMLELTIALFILTTAMVAIVQLVATTAVQRRNLEHRRLVLQELANQSERIALMPWDDTAPNKLTTWQPSSDLSAALPNAACTVEVTDELTPPTSRCLRLSVTWPNSVNEPLESSLTTWKFQSRSVRP